MAATVTRLAPAGQLTTPREAVTVYLATLAGAEQAGTRKIYGSVLRGLASAFAAEADVSAITAAALAEWLPPSGRTGRHRRGTSRSTPSDPPPPTGHRGMDR